MNTNSIMTCDGGIKRQHEHPQTVCSSLNGQTKHLKRVHISRDAQNSLAGSQRGGCFMHAERRDSGTACEGHKSFDTCEQQIHHFNKRMHPHTHAHTTHSIGSRGSVDCGSEGSRRGCMQRVMARGVRRTGSISAAKDEGHASFLYNTGSTSTIKSISSNETVVSEEELSAQKYTPNQLRWLKKHPVQQVPLKASSNHMEGTDCAVLRQVKRFAGRSQP